MKKYPRTLYLPWSPVGPGESRVGNVDHFVGREVVVTEKMDGECTTIHRDGCHARSLDTAPHDSRDWVRAFAATIVRPKILELRSDLQIVGENLYAVHSVAYRALPTYFLGFAACAEGEFRSWARTRAILEYLGVAVVPELYRGPWDEEAVRACFTGESVCGGPQEGYVVRLADGFALEDFPAAVAKFVRAGHVQTGEDWLRRPVVKNGLRGGQ